MSSVLSGFEPWSNGVLSGWTRTGEEAADTLHFVHGNGFCSATLTPLAHYLPSNWNLLFTDLPGHGSSYQPDLTNMPDWRAMAHEVGDAIEARSSGPVIGVGHSLGGIVTLLLAAERPHLFSRIVLLDPIFFSQSVIFAQALMRKTGIWQRTALVKSVAARRRTWPSYAEMQQDLAKKSLYKRWQPEALTAFIEGGTRATEQGLELSCNPAWEASIFGSYPKGLWRAVKTLSIPCDIYMATRSYGFIQHSARKASAINAMVRWHEIEGSHCFPMEIPEHTAPIFLDLPH